MVYRGVQFSLLRFDPEHWNYLFDLDGRRVSGRVQGRLELLAVRRVHLRINRELKWRERRLINTTE